MKRYYCFLVVVVSLVFFAGCTVTQIATKDDVSEAQGTMQRRQTVLSEEVISLKREVGALSIKVNDSADRNEYELKQQKRTKKNPKNSKKSKSNMLKF